MKKFFKVLVSMIAVVSILFSGCATNPDGSTGIPLDKVILVANLASYDGTVLYLSKHPDKKQPFILASASLGVLIENGVSVEALKGVLEGLPIKQLDSLEGRILIDNAFIIFGTFFNTKVEFNELEKIKALKEVAIAMKDGIDRGLAAVK